MTALERDRKGYYGIGIESGKTEVNEASLIRAATNFAADFIFTIGHRYSRGKADTPNTPDHKLLLRWDTVTQMKENIPEEVQLVGIEITEEAESLVHFLHPDRAVYILGSESCGLSQEALDACDLTVQIPSRECLNVAMAGTVVMYDRYCKRTTSHNNDGGK